MSRKVINYENVNGIMLSLDIDSRKSLPNARLFKISFKPASNQETSRWTKTTLVTAIIFNIIALLYVRIGLHTLMIITCTLGFLLFFWVTHSVQSETLQVIPTVGIQISIKYIYGKEEMFIPWSNVIDVIINEVVRLNRVLYYLTVLVNEDENTKLVTVFKCTRPRLRMLETVYSELLTLLRELQLQKGETEASGDTG